MLTALIIALCALTALAAGLLVALGQARRRNARLTRRIQARARELESLQQAFARFAPHRVVEDIIEQGVSSRSSKKLVTVLFADLKGFTAMSEKLDPAVLVEILNAYFQQMGRAIEAHRGHVSKLIGDGILALFGALEPNPWQADDAVHAALAMRQGLVQLNERLGAAGRPSLSIGIGIHRGEVVAGMVGSAQITEYTVLGSMVNLASRVETLTRRHGVDILVTDDVRAAIDSRFVLRAVGPDQVKGVSEPVATFAVEGFSSGSAAAPTAD